MEYAIITPVKNEEKYIRKTLETVSTQTLKPEKWVIVDDGSTDSTKNIIKNYTSNYEWIELVELQSYELQKEGGAKVVGVFNQGLKKIDLHHYDFIVKLDADLSLPEEYFERIANEFKANDDLGICGGYCVIEEDDSYVPEPHSLNKVRGAIKSYRVDCFKDIGGLPMTLNWDGLDHIVANFNGWKSRSLDLPVIHHKPTSTHINNSKEFYMERGKIDYKTGYDILLSYLRSINLSKRDSSSNSLKVQYYYMLGFFSSFLSNEEKFFNMEVRRFAKRNKYKDLFRTIKGD